MAFISFIFVLLLVLISVAFFTLMELKLLGFFHLRLGPDKVGVFGYFQPFADFVSTFEKSFSFLSSFFFFFFFFFSILSFIS